MTNYVGLQSILSAMSRSLSRTSQKPVLCQLIVCIASFAQASCSGVSPNLTQNNNPGRSTAMTSNDMACCYYYHPGLAREFGGLNAGAATLLLTATFC